MMDDSIRRKEAEFLKEIQKMDTLKKLKALFPDLKIATDRWKTERYSAASANARVEDKEVRRTCGCCGDAPTVWMPFLICEGVRVYSDPVAFTVQENLYYEDSRYLVEAYRKMCECGINAIITDDLNDRLLVQSESDANES